MDASLSNFESPSRFAPACAVTTFAVSVSVLAGWVVGIDFLKSALPGYPEMRPISAVAFLMLSVGLLLTVLDGRRHFQWIATALGSLTTATALVALAVYVLNFSSGAFSFVIPEMQPGSDSRGGRMCAAAIYVLLGASLVLLRSGSGRLRQLSGLFAVVVLVLTYALVLGNLYHAYELYGFSGINGTSLHLAFLSVVMAAGLLSRNRDCGIVRLLASDSLGGTAARRLIPLVILGPTLIGWLHVMGQDRGFYDAGFGSATSTFVLVMLMLATVLFYSRTMHRADEKRRITEAELADKEMRYRELFDYSQGLICIHDLDGRLTTVNRASLQLLGYSYDEMLGRSLRDFVPHEMRAQFDEYLRKVTHEGLANGLLELESKNGRRIVVRYYNVLAIEEGKEPYILGHAQDVTELLEAQKQLKNLSLTDELTGLYNRRGFLTLAEQQLKLEQHNGTARGLTLMFADMDGLKAINDTCGHEAGSKAIVTLARLIRSAVRGADLVARWGGDEFVILSIGSQDENCQLMVDRINERIDQYNAESGEPYLVACSIGVAPINLERFATFEETIAEADIAMYAEKRRRKAARGDISEPPNAFLRPRIEHSPRV
jgi:diguanylate cyclase (GGDEF)-like protein/PAS domain S-box-containing protein